MLAMRELKTMSGQTNFLRFDAPKERDKNGLTTSQECGEK
jgi:hypothetical protein